ncbi:MAG: GNAT family N-acetyltransferase [Candidatus Thermoplasmatota archaeon]|nr:GNAT family N-acetyltransferase [Candidatus Thermoplasmatota archaeon]
MRWIVDPDLFLFAEINGEPVAYLWATPDYNQLFKKMNGKLTLPHLIKFFIKKKQINTGKLHLIGIKKEFRERYIASYLNYEILKEMKKRGYQGAEIGWVDEKNTIAHKTIAITGAEVYKKSRVFEKKIQSNTQETDYK